MNSENYDTMRPMTYVLLTACFEFYHAYMKCDSYQVAVLCLVHGAAFLLTTGPAALGRAHSWGVKVRKSGTYPRGAGSSMRTGDWRRVSLSPVFPSTDTN